MVTEEPTPEKDPDVAHGDSPLEETRQHAEHAARRASPWVDRMARAGYVAKGVVYATIGVLAMRKALGLGGRQPGWAARCGAWGPSP